MEVIVEVIIENVIKGLSSYAVEEFSLLYNLKDDFRKMKSTVSAIKAVLLNAEAKAANPQISDWLVKLKDVLYDADDLFDDFSYEALRGKVMTKNLMAKKVRIFFSKSNQVFFCFKMGSRMKEIRKRLDEISYEKNNFQLDANYSPRIPFEYKEWRETYSFVRKSDVIGREEEKKVIMGNLLDFNVKDVVSVIPIVGIGGLGKTALAQLVYNDKSVLDNFQLNMWVCVSDDFSVKHIAQKMLGHQTNGNQIEQVQQELRHKIKDKRFLLVLDDVWNENLQLWHQLRSLLMEGAKGSKIIVTTRSAKVANIMGTFSPIQLSGLGEERSWELFCQVAFKNGEQLDNLELVSIGKNIVKKCVGVPLAIRTISSLLSENLTISTWKKFRDTELMRIEEGEKQIFSILRLSYDYLPSQIKNCFAYCSLFPKDFIFERRTLIQLWVAQGFIHKSDTIRSEEDVGHDYFMNLLSRSFFQDVEMDDYGEILECKMHDLMHDLALLVAGDEQIIVSEGKEVNINDRARHLSFGFALDDQREVPTSLFKANKLRTFLLPCQNIHVSIEKSFFHSLTSAMKCSRVLDFNWFHVIEIPKSVGKLKHLRYLDLSCSNIKMLPQGITNLVMLQSLKLNGCKDLEVLPRGINKLVSLRHLELEDTDSLRCMPCGLGQLTCLQTLTDFVVSKDDGARISELGLLNNLSGWLSIRGLQHLRGDTSEVESVKLLLDKQYIQEFYLYWEKRDELEEVARKDEMLLNALQPHPSIKGLHINGFCGRSLPEWIGNLSSLQRLSIWDCHGLERLPESIGNWSELRRLYIYGCSNLKSLPESTGNLSSLQTLYIWNCPGLERLPESMGNLSSLQTLSIWNCPGLERLPESMGNLSSLQTLYIWNCPGLERLPESMGNLSSLQTLYIRNCEALSSLPDGMQNLKNLKELHIHNCPQLRERCKRDEGEDWPKIAHIPHVRIYY